MFGRLCAEGSDLLIRSGDGSAARCTGGAGLPRERSGVRGLAQPRAGCGAQRSAQATPAPHLLPSSELRHGPPADGAPSLSSSGL